MPNDQNRAVQTGAGTYSSAMADATNYMAWILDSFGPYLAGPVLEIGVGHGSYASELRACGPYMGVDIDKESVAEARQRFPDLDFAVADITNPDFPETLAGDGFRSIVCLNVLEHIQDHGQAVKNLAGALVRGGHLLVVVPALQILYNDLDRLAGHHRRYRRDEFRDLMVQAGLEPVRVDYFNPVGGFGWWANRLMRHRSLNDTAVNSQISLFDRWLVPVSRGLNPVTRTLFGQSVLAIGRKP
ncbi:class I SAM-dependent methyltransferase [Bradyrhizobium tropiciagri]|uniref:class I SAM-dependent methyltransferase n=1 Tax=Bradyrhizobium tropiciagri TaxID=312253 RepID=UPI001BAB1A7B|nr:class I SAM-dependent methyltransferase [Bradyrhizobium tropiciagri]